MTERPIIFSGPMVRALLDGRKTQTRRVVRWPRGTGPCDGEWCCASRWEFKDDGWFCATCGAGVHPSGKPAGAEYMRCPYGVPGDTLWARESWALHERFSDVGRVVYAATANRSWTEAHQDFPIEVVGDRKARPFQDGFKPSIHMPRWASRLTLTITEVRIERLQDITEADAIAEGLYRSLPDDTDRDWFIAYTEEQNGSPPTPAEWDAFNAGVWMVPGVPQGWGRTPAERRRDTWGPTPQFCYRLLWDHIHGRDSWDANPWVWALTFDVQVRS